MKAQFRHRKAVLLTGFGPFPGMADNPSADCAIELADHAQSLWPDCHFTSHIFPTEWMAVDAMHCELRRQHCPALTLHFGVQSRSRSIGIERYARNFASCDPDNAGFPGCRGPIADHGPFRRQTSLPCYPMLAALRKAGISAHISTNAGSYLCNYLFYKSLAQAWSDGQKEQTGFIHIPAHLKSKSTGRKSLSDNRKSNGLIWPELMQAGLIIINQCLQKARLANRMPQSELKSYISTHDMRRKSAQLTG